MSAGEERIEVLHVGGQTATEFFLHFFLKVQQGKGMFAWVKSLCVPFTEYLGEHYRSLSDNTHFSPKSLLTWNIAKVKGGRETEDGRGKRQHICLNLTPLLTTLRRLHYGAHHCPASSRQSLFHCANSAPWKDCKNKRWMSKAKVNRISPFFCRAGEVCTNTSLRDREERRALWRKELEEVGASSHEKAKTVRSCLLDSWAYWKLPYASIWMKDPQNTQDITLKTKHKEWNGDLWMPRTQRLQNASVSKRREKKLAHNNIVIKKHVNLPQNDIRCMKTRQSLQSFQCPGLKSTLSRPKQGFNCQGQLMRATSAPSNLQGQRQSVINCCVHKCKWVHWGSRRRGGGGKGLSGQYSSGEQSAREGNDLEDSTQICCSVKHEEAECEGRLVEMEEVVVRIGRKNNGNNCGGNKYQPLYSSCLFSIRPLQRYGLSHHQNKKKNTISHCSWVLLCGKMFLSFFMHTFYFIEF